MTSKLGQYARIGFFVGFLSVASLFVVPSLRAFVLNMPWIPARIAHFIGTNAIDLFPTTKPKITTNLVPASRQDVIDSINIERNRIGLSSLVENFILSEVAQLTVVDMQGKDDTNDVFEDNMTEFLSEKLKERRILYNAIHHIVLIGPVTQLDILYALLAEEKQAEQLYNSKFTDIGVGMSSTGHTIIMLLEPLSEENRQMLIESRSLAKQDLTPVATRSVPTPVPTLIPEISDDEVYQALNSYRRTHGLPDLLLDNNLCAYAEKRVRDLIEFGGLDGHAGFQRDFDVADPEDLPEHIKRYGSGMVGENLAYQRCRNMTTGEGFLAETGVSLIEWCFDSSTAGHREAQLSTQFENVCVRHGGNMYVIIFGQRNK